MRGLGELFGQHHRSTVISVTDTDTGVGQTYEVVSNIAPSWSSAGYRGALSIPGVWRATMLLADLIGGLPWHAYRQRAGSSPQRVDPPPPLLDRPNPPDTRMTTFSAWTMDLLLQGNAIGVYTARNTEGWPTACVPVPADQVYVRRVERGDGIPLPAGTVAYQIGDAWYPSSEILHVKGPCAPGALRGVGALEVHLNETFALARQQARWARTADNAAVPTGVLRNTDGAMDQQKARVLKDQWKRSQQERTVAVLSSNLEFTALGWSPSDAQLLDARRYTAHEIALIFGLDPSWLGAAQTSRVYSNIEQEGINLVRYSLSGWLARFEQALTAALPRGTYVKANTDAIMRADTLGRYQAHEIGIRAGFLSRDEARDLEERPPLTATERDELINTQAPAPNSAVPRLDDKRRPA